MSGGEVTEAEVDEALQRVVAWPEIARSMQLANFLYYIVRRTLEGEAGAIKAYSIAVDVFGRTADFDPQSDPIVRVQARRLRTLLDQYYAGDGAADAVRITLPTGRYVPDFVRQVALQPDAVLPDVADLSGQERRRFGRTSMALAGLVAAGLMLAVGVSLWQQGQGQTVGVALIEAPVVSVTELDDATGEGGNRAFAAGLAVELVTDLQQFETLTVLYDGGNPDDLDADFEVGGEVRRVAGGLLYHAVLRDTERDAVVWSKDVTVTDQALRGPLILNEVSEKISRSLGSPRGPLHVAARTLMEQGSSFAGAENLYLCRVLFDLYRERVTAGSSERAQRCFAGLPESVQQTPQAKAAMASLLVDGLGPIQDTAEEQLREAGDTLRLAVEQAPISGFVWEQRARYLESRGQHEWAEGAYSASLQLNPASVDAIAARARHLALSGRIDEAEALADVAIESESYPPNWYMGVPALVALRERDFRPASIYAYRYAEADPELGTLMVLIALQGLGEQGVVANTLPRLLELPGFRRAGILTQLRKRISDAGMIRDIRVALLEAGAPPEALNAAF